MPATSEPRKSEPAASVIAKLGGPIAVAKLVGVNRLQAYYWTYPKERRGTGGIIPLKYHRAILAEAERRGVPLTAEDLLPVSLKSGTPAPDVSA